MAVPMKKAPDAVRLLNAPRLRFKLSSLNCIAGAHHKACVCSSQIQNRIVGSTGRTAERNAAIASNAISTGERSFLRQCSSIIFNHDDSCSTIAIAGKGSNFNLVLCRTSLGEAGSLFTPPSHCKAGPLLKSGIPAWASPPPQLSATAELFVVNLVAHHDPQPDA
jgi:hypothetical protein